MATAETNTDGDQTLSPSEEDSPPVSDYASGPLNFSELTPSQFGISVQSFTPAALSKSKDKSRLTQMRRRSSIGVRGSPETNSLIRFTAQQRMKTPPTFRTPELVRSSPFLPRVASTLRQKMASFQSLMDVEESEVCDPMPRQDSDAGGCIKTRDYLSDRSSPYGGKENHPPMVTPTPSKRRRLGPVTGCEVEVREAGASVLHLSLKEQEQNEPVGTPRSHLREEEEPAMEVVTRGPLTSRETVEDDRAVLISPTLHTDPELQSCSPAENQQDDVFELQSLGRPPPDDSAAASPGRPAPPLHTPALMEMKPTGSAVVAGEDDSAVTSAVRKKRVCFGGPLSPEFFDKNLPPSTPLQRGGTPARAPTPGGGLQPRSVLKTPQRNESQTTRAQPDLSGPAGFGASPTLSVPRNRRMDEDGLTVSPLMEETVSAGTRSTERQWEAQPLNLNAAFHEEFLCHMLTESETGPSTPSQEEAPDEPTPSPEKEKQHGADVEAPAAAQCRERRKQPEESQPVKRSTRSAAKTASGNMKRSSAAARRWNRSVDRSLYGCRAYASKNPALSPITESLALTGRAAARQTSRMSCTAPNHETHSNPEMTNGTRAAGDLAVTKALENPSEDVVTTPNSSKRSGAGQGRRLSGPRFKRRRLKKRTVSVAIEALLREETSDQAGGKTEEHQEDQTTANLEASSETPLTSMLEQNAQIPVETLCTDSDGKLECNGSPDAPTSDCPPSGGESNDTSSQSAQREPDSVSVLQEEEQEHQAAVQQEDIRSSSDSQEEVEVADFQLAPWQADFNVEDVFKPVATRRQRLVRRSLRNQSTTEHSSSSSSAGLAWLAWTSPESSKESCRKTRGRRLSAALPVQPPLPEETQDNAS